MKNTIEILDPAAKPCTPLGLEIGTIFAIAATARPVMLRIVDGAVSLCDGRFVADAYLPREFYPAPAGTILHIEVR